MVDLAVGAAGQRVEAVHVDVDPGPAGPQRPLVHLLPHPRTRVVPLPYQLT